MRGRLYRAVVLLTATSLFVSATATGLEYLAVSGAQALRAVLRARPGTFTDRPTKPYLGPHPGRASATRGGLWSKDALFDAQAPGPPTFASLWQGPPPPPQHTLAVDAAPGSTFPWEGSAPAAGGSVNTANGNKLTAVNLVRWRCRGGMVLDFTLYHNSETNYNDELGYGWSWTYDIYISVETLTATVHWGDGLCIPFTASGNDFVAPTGIHDRLVHNQDGTWTLTKKSQVAYTFNSSGFCNRIEDRNGNAITITLNSGNYATRITDPTGRYLDINVSNGHFTSVTDPLSRTWSFTRNFADDLTTVTWPTLDSTQYTDGFAYGSHRITRHTDRRGKYWDASYNTDGSIASQTDPLSHATGYSYAATATTVTDPLSHTRAFNYSLGRLASVVDESGYSVGYTYDSNLNVTRVTDKRGKYWDRTFDSNGNVLTLTDPLSHTWTSTYNSTNDLLTVEDPLGHTWTATRNSAGKVTAVGDPLSHSTSLSWDSSGQLESVTDPQNHSVTIAYDSHGAPSSATDALGHATSVARNGLGMPTSVTDALNHATSVAYDAWGRPVTITHPDSSTVTVAYNAVGQVTSTTDENSHSTTYAYDDAGRLTGLTNAKNESESYGYDNANRRTTVTNGRGKTRTYAYNSRGDVTSLTLPDSSVESWSTNGNGDVTAYTNPLSQVIYYGYDDAGRTTGVDYPTGTDTSFSYDNANRRTQMVDSTGTTGWTYDAANRLTGLNTPQGNMTYAYDTADRRTSMTDSTGTTTYGYDAADRLTSLENPFGETTSWTYDDADRTTRQTFASGAYTDYGYDSRDRQTSVAHRKSDNSTISSESYSYDSAGNLTDETVDSVTTSYTYDAIDQLLSETRTGYDCSYTYDANGNRLTKTLNNVTENYSYDDGDKLTAAGGKTYGYDAAGRTTSVTQNSQTTTLAYDYESRITQITYPNNSTNTFSYNGLDTRVGKVDSSGTKTYRRDGESVTDPVLSDGASTFTPGISVRTSGATKFLHDDRLGTLGRETNSSQATTATKTYDAFGMPISSTGTSASPFGFAGGYGYQEDQDSGLKLLGHRYYDPSTGRFLTRDPVRDGRNWYVYAANAPTRHLDPTGTLIPLVVFAVVAALVIVDVDLAIAPTHDVKGDAEKIEDCREHLANIKLIALMAFVAEAGEGLVAGVRTGLALSRARPKPAAVPTAESLPADYPAIPCPWPDGAVPGTRTPPPGWSTRRIPEGNFTNPVDFPGVSIRPDLTHPGKYGPHWDIMPRKWPKVRVPPGPWYR